MNFDNLTIGEAKAIAAMFGRTSTEGDLENNMIGDFVVVRCRDAGVHAGVLEAYNGRSCVLSEARRLWYWKPADGAKFLSGVAANGLHSDSKIGVPVQIHLTESCEIIRCSEKAAKSIRGHVSDAD